MEMRINRLKIDQVEGLTISHCIVSNIFTNILILVKLKLMNNMINDKHDAEHWRENELMLRTHLAGECMWTQNSGSCFILLILIRKYMGFRSYLLSFLYRLKKTVLLLTFKVIILLVQDYHFISQFIQCFLSLVSFKNPLITFSLFLCLFFMATLQ